MGCGSPTIRRVSYSKAVRWSVQAEGESESLPQRARLSAPPLIAQGWGLEVGEPADRKADALVSSEERSGESFQRGVKEGHAQVDDWG